MKKLFLILLFLLLAVSPVAADEIPLTITPSPSPKPSVAVVNDYALPYPGLLPDSPLYVFKAIRDKLVSVLIKDPKKQAEFDLLQADKRIAAAMYLLQESRSKEQLALQTVSKGDNYFFFAIENAAIAKKRGEDVNGFLDTMLSSAQKHEQIMKGLDNHSSPSFHKGIQHEFQRVKEFVKEINQIK